MSRCAPGRPHAATAQPCQTSGGGTALRWVNREKLALADETDDVLCRFHGLSGDGAGTVGAVDQDGIDVAGVGDQPFHLGSDWRQFGDAEFDQRILEVRKLPAAELAEHLGLGVARQRGIDPDQIVRFGTRLETLFLRR